VVYWVSRYLISERTGTKTDVQCVYYGIIAQSPHRSSAEQQTPGLLERGAMGTCARLTLLVFDQGTSLPTCVANRSESASGKVYPDRSVGTCTVLMPLKTRAVEES
jgi:hypothetical protein